MAAKYAVNGDQYRKIDRRMREIKRQLDQEDGSPLDPEQVVSALQLIIEGDIPKPVFKRDMRKESGWKLEKEGPAHPARVTKLGDLELVSFLNYDEQCITGTEFEKRAEKLGADLGQHTAEWLLEHQREIPEEWRKHYLVFAGSVWRYSFDLRVPYLGWSGNRWYLDFDYLASDFSSYDRLVLPRK